MGHVTYTMHERPVPKERPRVANGHAYTPSRTRQYEKRIRSEATQARILAGQGQAGPKEPVFLIVVAIYHGREAGEHVTVPDVDNLLKSHMDALQGVLYSNDSQVFCALPLKYRTAGAGKTIVHVFWGEDAHIAAQKAILAPME